MQLVICPDCGAPADIAWQEEGIGRADGSRLAKVHCVRRHWFLMPTDQLLSA